MLELGRELLDEHRLSRFRECPLYPQKRTCAQPSEMSAKCHKRTLAWISLEFINGKRKPQVGRPIGCRFTVAVVSTSKRVTQRRRQFG
ncbi:unnamed protein product [marine sediment metagenome]|uniref:Uncharacterized protein n=1 Tax=marine sediment metagenome TaxID=412755 RepID=X0S9E2_9ZZZZ